MRVAMVSEHASPLAALGGVDAGGQNVHVAALAAAMGRRGADVTVHTRRDDPDRPRRVRLASGATVHHVQAGPARELPKDALFEHMDAFSDELRRTWDRRPPDVVHAHFWMSGYAALRAARPLEIPVVQTFHALGVVKRRYHGERDTSPRQRPQVEHEILRSVDRVVATCTDELFELLRLGASNQLLTVIPCGVDLRAFTADGPREAVPEGRRRLVCVGRLVERKGIGNAISALAALPGTELVIAGGPPEDELDGDPEVGRLRGLAAEHGVADRVDFRGRVEREQLPALLRSADAVVAAPWYEPFGMVPLEAMACGVPVVAAAVGGMIDTVVDGRTGVHVPPRDPERLAAALRGLLADPELCAEYGRAGVRRARQLYDWDRIAASTLDVYSQLPRSRRRVRARDFALPPRAEEHVCGLAQALREAGPELARLEQWGTELARRLSSGGRLLAVGNGGSAAQAQHLTAELVGRYVSEREALSAICLHGDTSSLTAIANDYGLEEAFARQVRAHGRPGDVLLALSTSGHSPNVVAAARSACELGMTAWSLCGENRNPLAGACDDAVCLPAPSVATVQELHLVGLHVICSAVDRELALERRGEAQPAGREVVA